MTKSVALAAAAALLISAAPMTAEAFPIAAAPVAASADAGVTLVSGGCGPYAHRGPLLGCRPNRPFVRPLLRPVYRPICRTVLLPLPHRVCR